MKPRFQGIIQRRIFALVPLVGAILFFVYDIVADWLYEEEYGSFHFVVELIVFFGVSVALVIGVRDLRRLRARLSRETQRNKLFTAELMGSINHQMNTWGLTPSEKDVAWFIIKGNRFSEIAEARGVKENTARLQASSIYSKAGVSGRVEFVAEIFQPLLMSIPNNASHRRSKMKSELGPH